MNKVILMGRLVRRARCKIYAKRKFNSSSEVFLGSSEKV